MKSVIRRNVQGFFSYGWLITACFVLLAYCLYYSGQKNVWMDEVCSYYPAAYPAFTQMLSYINDTIVWGHHLYFTLLWLWAKIFGTSALALRLFSALNMCITISVFWHLLRRTYGTLIANITVVPGFLLSYLILNQAVEIRFYGFLIMFCALLTFWTVVTESKTEFAWKTALGQLFFHASLLFIHPFGILYSSLHLAAAIIYDYRRKTLRWWYYGAGAAGWLLWLPVLPTFIGQLQLASPNFWIQKPPFKSLQELFFSNMNLNTVYVVLLAYIFVLYRTSKISLSQRPHDGLLLTIGVLYLILPVAVWLQSLVFKPLFISRYLIGSVLGQIIIVAAFLSAFLPKEGKQNLHLVLAPFFICMYACIAPFIDSTYKVWSGYSNQHIAWEMPERDTPIVLTSSYEFLPATYHSRAPERYYYPLDWDIATSPYNANQASTMDYHIMEAFQRQVPQLHILSTTQFLNEQQRFLVSKTTFWYQKYIENNPEYSIDELEGDMVLVQKRSEIPKWQQDAI